MDKKYDCNFFDEYEIDAWLPTLGSAPAKLLASHDRSESYEMDRAAVVQLENGKYALITESGCSCYDTGDAQIELFPSQGRAMAQYANWLGDR